MEQHRLQNVSKLRKELKTKGQTNGKKKHQEMAMIVPWIPDNAVNYTRPKRSYVICEELYVE
jgi:hypothetical protein